MSFVRPILSLLLLLGITLAHAEGRRWYDVEVIFFAYNSDAGLQEEYWPEDPGEPDMNNAVTVVDSFGAGLPGQITEYQTLSLNTLANVHNRLQRSSRYRVIHQMAWRQPGLSERYSPPVMVLGGQPLAEPGRAGFEPTSTSDRGSSPFSASPAATADDTSLQATNEMARARYELEGRIKISLSKFLDVDADLLYRTRVASSDVQGNPANVMQPFRLTEFRRMRSKTIHYLDHPMFGMIITATPYQPAGLTSETAAVSEIASPSQ